MSFDSPPTLFYMAKYTLLKKESLAISALKKLPCHLFPEMLKGAITYKRTKVLTAIVSAWPFPCLPVGALIEELHLDSLKALLDGLDVLLQKRIPSSRYKLRVLDLRKDMHLDFWGELAGSHDDDLSPQIIAQKKPVDTCPHPRRKKHFKVVTDFELKANLDEWTIYLLQWVQPRKSSIHLCCKKLHSWDSPDPTVINVLKSVDLNCLLELWLSHWGIELLVDLVPYMEEMKNLHTLMLKGIKKSVMIASEDEEYEEDEEDEWKSTLLSQFSNFLNLQHLYLNDIDFLEDGLEEWLSCLPNPLETLSITDCPWLLQSDLEYLPDCLTISKLKHLKLNSIFLSDAGPELPGLILEKVTSTLQILELEQCGMRDSHFKALLPALSKCSQLLKVNFCHNDISLLVLKKLLHCTAKLSQLTQEIYPAPLECYEDMEIHKDKFKQLCPELLKILRAHRQPRKVSFATTACRECLHSCNYYHNLVFRDCLCAQVE